MVFTNNAPPLECLEIDEPPPPRIPRDQRRQEMFQVLLGLPVGGKGIEVNRKPTTMEFYANRLRKKEKGVRFLVRPAKPGCSRVWRVA